MIVKCIKNNCVSIAGAIPNGRYYGDSSLLEVGKYYVVYAMYISEDISFHIDTNSYLPGHFPSSLFDMVDPRLSKYWVLGSYCKPRDNSIQKFTILSYPEWALNYPEFWEKFVDGDKDTRDRFYRFKELVDHEYQIKSVLIHAKVVDDGWSKCEKCENIWAAEDSAELVNCPDCNEILINDFAVSKNAQLIES